MRLEELSTCSRCHRFWSEVSLHETPYKFVGHIQVATCFPLCEQCWQELTPETRLPYYRALFETWERFGPQPTETWLLIDEAVRKGL